MTETPAWVSNGTDAASAHNASFSLFTNLAAANRGDWAAVGDRGKDETRSCHGDLSRDTLHCSGSNRSL